VRSLIASCPGELTAVFDCDPLSQREAETDPFGLAGDKRLEQRFGHRWGRARSGVAHVDDDRVIFG
jgi:hypothetical protein